MRWLVAASRESTPPKSGTGAAVYAGHIDLPGQAWLKIVFCGVPHARIESLYVRGDLAHARRHRSADRGRCAGQ